MSAAAGGLTLNVDQFNQIGGALQLLDPNGEVDHAATQAFIAGVAAQLGDNFVQQTLADDLHTDFVKQGGSFGIQQIGMLIVTTVMVIATQGASLALNSAELAAQQAALDAAITALAEGGTAAMAEGAAATVTGGLLSSGMFAAGTLGNAMASAFIASAFTSAVSQVMTNGKLDFGDMLTAGAVSAVTAGLTRGITYSDTNGFGFSTEASPNSLENLAGTNPSIAQGVASNAVKSTASDIARQLAAMAGVSAIQAGVQSAIQGGSFLDALKASGVSNLSAALAYQIGSLGPETLGQLGYVGAHAALGCASSAASGTGCGGGAIGAATSAVLSPLLRDALYNGAETVTYTDNGDGTITKTVSYDNTAINAGIALMAGLSGAGLSGLLGQNPNAGATAAQNEATNNALSVKSVTVMVATPFGPMPLILPIITNDPIIGTPNNGPKGAETYVNPIEAANGGNTMVTPNNGPGGVTITGTPLSDPLGVTILSNPGCLLSPGLCASLNTMAQLKDGADKISSLLGINSPDRGGASRRNNGI